MLYLLSEYAPVKPLGAPLAGVDHDLRTLGREAVNPRYRLAHQVEFNAGVLGNVVGNIEDFVGFKLGLVFPRACVLTRKVHVLHQPARDCRTVRHFLVQTNP
jgi:hypothetical protein